MAKYSNTIQYNITTKLDASGFSQLQAQIKGIEGVLNNLSNKRIIDSRQFSEATAHIKNLQTALTSAFNVNTGMLNMQKFFGTLSTSNTSLTQLASSFSLVGSKGQIAFTNLLGSIGKLDTQLKSTNTTINKIGTTLGNTVRWGVIASVFQEVMNSAHRAVQYMEDLDKSLTDIQMVGHSTAEDMRQLALEANNAAKAIGSTTVAYTDATKIFVQQGLSLDQSQQFAEMSLKLANVAGESAADAAEQITALKNGFQMAGDTVESSLDKIVKTSHITASSVEELATASTRVAATANALGVSDEQLYSQLSTIIQVTREAPEIVGNSLKTIYARFADLKLGETLEDGMDLGAFSSTLEKLGVHVLDSNGQLREMGSIIEDLMTKWDGFDRATKQGAAVTLAGKFQYNRLLTLLENADAYRDTLDKLQNDSDVEGLLNTKNDEVYLESLEGKLNQLQSAFEGFMSSIFNQRDFAVVLDFFKNATDGATSFIDAIGGGIPVLTLLGSTMTKVFSNQIAGQINNFVSNRQANQEKTQSAAIARDELNRYYNQQGVSPVNDYTTKQIEAADKALAQFAARGKELQSVMSPEQVDAWNNAIDRSQESIVELIKDTSELTQQTEALKIALNAVGDREEPQLDRDQVRENVSNGFYTDQDLEKANAKLSELKTNYQQVIAEQNNLITVANKVGSSGELSVNKWGEQVNNLRIHLEELIEETNSLSPKAYENMTKAAQKLNEILDSDTIDAAELNKILESLLPTIGEMNSQLQVINGGPIKTTTAAFEEMEAKVKASEAVVESYGNSFTQMQDRMNQQVEIRGIVDSIAAIGQLAFAWQSFQHLGSLWVNSDIDMGEKVLQTIINIGMNIPMLLTAFSQLKENNLGQALSNWNAQFGANSQAVQRWTRNTNILTNAQRMLTQSVNGNATAQRAASIATGQSTTALRLQSFAVKTLSTASKVATTAVRGLGAAISFLSGPAGLALMAVVGILSTASSMIQQQVEEARKAANEAAEEQRNISTTIADSANSWNELYKKYDKTTGASEEFIKASRDIVEQLNIQGGQALITAGQYDELAKAIARAQDDQLNDRITANQGVINSYKGDFTGGTLFNGSVRSDVYSAITSKGKDNAWVMDELHKNFDKVAQDDIPAVLAAIDNFNKALSDKISDTRDKLQNAIGEERENLQKELDVFTQVKSNVDAELQKEDYTNTKEAYSDNVTAELQKSAFIEATKNAKEYQDIVNYITNNPTLSEYWNNLANQVDQADFILKNLNQDAENYLEILTEINNIKIDEGISNLASNQYDGILQATNDNGVSVKDQIVSRFRDAGYNGLISDNVIEEAVDELVKGSIDSFRENSNLTERQKEEILSGIDWSKPVSEILSSLEQKAKDALDGSIDMSNYEPKDADVDVDKFQSLAKYLQQNAHLLDDFNNEIETNADLLALVTEAQLRYDAALERSAESIDDWEDALRNASKGSSTYAIALDELNNTYKDLLDIGQELDLSSDFTGSIENLELLRAAIEGDTEAYNELRNAAMEDILINANVNLEQFDSELGIIFDTLNQIEEEGLTDIEIDALLNSEGFTEALEEIINAAGMTQEQANAFLSMIGLSADVETETSEEQTPQTAVGWRVVEKPVTLHGTNPSFDPLTGERTGEQPFSYDVPGFEYEPVPTDSVGIITSGGFSLQTTAGNGETGTPAKVSISNVKKVSTGGSKARNTSSRPSSSGGSGGKKSGGGSGGKKGSGGSGGSGKTYEAKQKDQIEEEIDRYERVDTLLSKVEGRYDNVNKNRSRLTGHELAKEMTKEIGLLEDQVALHEHKLKIQQQEAEELRKSLESEYGAWFDSEGFLANYADIHKRLEEQVNSLITQYNNTVTEEGQEALEKQIEDAEDALAKFKKVYQRYDELWGKDIQDTMNTLDDLKDKIEDIYVEAMQKQIDASKSLKDLEEDIIEFNAVFSGLNKDDPLRNMMTSAQKLEKYFDANTEAVDNFYSKLIKNLQDLSKQEGISEKQREFFINQINKYQAAWAKAGAGTAEAGGTGYFDMAWNNVQMMLDAVKEYQELGSALGYGEDAADIYDLAKDALQTAIDMVMDFEDELENLNDAILDMIDNMNDRLEERRDLYQNITDELDHQLEIWELLHGDEDYENLNKLLEAQQQNYQQNIQEQQQQLELLKDMLKDLEEGSDQWKKVQEMIVETQENLNDLVEESLDNLRRQYENTVSSIGDAWVKDALGTDLDWMQEQWEMINRNADYYLDDVNAAYEIQKLQNKYLNLLDDATGLGADKQRQITEQMQQQLAYLREKEKISEYDVAYAEAQLELLQRRIALEEAQRNKNQIKLRRDSQGNYNYVYTTDDSSTRDAEQDYLDAQNNAYNLSKEQMKQTQEDSLSALQDARRTIDDIWKDANLSLEEKTKRTEEVLDSLREYLAGTSEQLSESQKNIINDFIGMCDILTDENDQRLQEVYEQIVNGNNDAFDEIDTRWSDAITSWLQNMDDFSDATDRMFQDLVDNAVDYQEQTNIIADLVDQNFGDITDAIDRANEAMQSLTSSNAAFIDQLKNDAGVVRDYNKTMQDYSDKIKDAENSMRDYQDQVNDLHNQVAEKERENSTLASQIADIQSKYESLLNGGSEAGNMDGAGGYSLGQLTEGIAGNIWTYGTWGNGSTRLSRLKQKFGDEKGEQVYAGVQQLFNGKPAYGYQYNPNAWATDGYGYYKQFAYSSFDTGGYTGNWSDGDNKAKNGKLAWLHSKEIVLNETDTQYILQAVDAVRGMVQSIKGGALSGIADAFIKGSWSPIEQQVSSNEWHVTAEFPNAESAQEIREALLSLEDLSSQYVNKIR